MLVKNIGQLLHFNEKFESLISENAYFISENGIITEVGLMSEIKQSENAKKQEDILDVKGKVVTPGFVDSHTHLVFGGDRSEEFILRAHGATYEEILATGGGINNTVSKTRELTFTQLFQIATERLNIALKYGITTIEIKSGYGLDEITEWKILEVIKYLKKFSKQKIKATYLGAHIVPREYKEKREDYIKLITDKMLPLIKEHNMADFIDIFVEKSAYSIDESEIILKKAKELGFEIKLHAEQLSHLGGIELGVKYNALSVDHVDCFNEKDVELLKNSKTVATMLPTSILFLNKNDYPDARPLLNNNIRVAVATDFNPGSSHSLNINLAISLSVLKHKMDVLNAIKGATLNGAYSLNMQNETGSIETGKHADFLVHNTKNYKNIAYQMGDSLIQEVYINGEKVYSNTCKEQS